MTSKYKSYDIFKNCNNYPIRINYILIDTLGI